MAYQPLHRSEKQDAVLQQLVAVAAQAGAAGVGVFDLDGCLFDTRPRQVQIFREFASQQGVDALYSVREEHFQDWDLEHTLRNIGLSAEEAAEIFPDVKTWWWHRFFSSEYVIFDHAMPGSVELVSTLRATGLQVVYLTGRDETMREGTELCLQRFGFPLDGDQCRLIVKPDFDLDDTLFKEGALRVIAEMGDPVIFLDNEPSNVNTFHERFPEAMVVFVATDHSPKPVVPDSSLSQIRGFLRG